MSSLINFNRHMLTKRTNKIMQFFKVKIQMEITMTMLDKIMKNNFKNQP